MHRAEISAIEPAGDVALITARCPGFSFQAGQYITIGPASIPMSVASAPSRLPEFTLHYRAEPGSADAAALDQVFALGQTAFDFDGPFGNIRLVEPYPAGLMVIAGGTGASQARSIIDEIAVSPERMPTTLFWCVSEPLGLYQDVYFEELAFHADWFTYRAFIDDRAGRSPVHDWLATTPLTAERYVLGGGPGFVYSIVDRLTALGVLADQLHSDVFDYAPRQS